MNKKSIITILCVFLLVGATVLGVLAYLTDRASVANTFTVGNVDITLDESKVDADGVPVDPAERTEEGNNYHLIPGKSYTKDPIMTVEAKSEESYVRMIVKVNCMDELDAIFGSKAFVDNQITLEKVFTGYDPATWQYVGVTRDDAANTMKYEFRYKETVKASTVDQKLPALFTAINVPGTITGEQLATLYSDDNDATNDLKIEVEGHAIQAETFATAEEAWSAFDVQYGA